MEEFISIVIVSIALVAVSVTMAINNNKWQKNVIERGYAQYCPTTGDFAWKGECE